MNYYRQGFHLVELMVVVAIIGILAVIAFPLYQDYIIRARMTAAFLEIGKAKTDLAEFYALKGRFPVDGTERSAIEIVAADKNPTIRTLAIHGVGACNLSAGCSKSRMEVQLQRSVYLWVGGDSYSQLRLEGQAQSGGTIIWLCGPRDVQPVKLEWLPSTCRYQF